ncbi:hypothetical protein JXJ21_12570 [candidate division KSB1 bacterium]|nr:hypothetical protein [candidate division KSB1 bacterium]
MNSKILLLFILLFLVSISYMSCDRQPTSPETTGQVNLHFEIAGRQLNGNTYLMKPAHSFTRVVIEVYSSSDAVSVSSIAQTPVARLEVALSASDTEFEGKLLVPAGEKQLLVAKLYENRGESELTSIANDEVISFYGRQNVTVEAGAVVEARIELLPAPIKNERVVIHVGSVEAQRDTSAKYLPISVANLDSIRGIQLDLIFETTPSMFSTISVRKTARSQAFSNIDFNVLNTEDFQVRILMYDRTEGAALLPLKDASASPGAVAELGFRIASSIQPVASPTISVKAGSAFVTTDPMVPLEVWVVDGEINLSN